MKYEKQDKKTIFIFNSFSASKRQSIRRPSSDIPSIKYDLDLQAKDSLQDGQVQIYIYIYIPSSLHPQTEKFIPSEVWVSRGWHWKC